MSSDEETPLNLSGDDAWDRTVPQWINASSQGHPPADDRADDIASMDDFFRFTRSDGEPATVFDENTPTAPRELKISREGDALRLPEGHIINERFEVRTCLGEGEMGTVYLVDDLRLKDKKALKLMHPVLIDSEVASERFISEIKTLQRLSHENIIRVYDYGKTDVSELSFFTMEYIEGMNLRDLLKKKGGSIPIDKGVHLAGQILDTLVYAHQHRVHRNLKPVNIMVRPTGKVVLLNFGLSKGSIADIPDRRRNLGNVHYQAPEQSLNPMIATPQVDLYAVGAILYQLLTGQVPTGQPSPPSRINRQLPRPLDTFVMRLLETRPERRFASASDAKAALNRAVQPAARWLWYALFALLTIAAIFLGWYYV